MYGVSIVPKPHPVDSMISLMILIVLMLPNAYIHCLFTVTVSDMKSGSAYAFMCVMVVTSLSHLDH